MNRRKNNEAFWLGTILAVLVCAFTLDIYKYMLIAALVSLSSHVYDKQQAAKGQYRVAEGYLIGLSFVGGWFGAMVAIFVLNHKRKKMAYIGLTIIAMVVHITAMKALTVLE